MSLVVQDLLGEDIVNTKLLEGWHFYNKIDGQYYDLTKSQFQEEMVICISHRIVKRHLWILMKHNIVI
jgi:hypothetical protein